MIFSETGHQVMRVDNLSKSILNEKAKQKLTDFNTKHIIAAQFNGKIFIRNFNYQHV